MTLGNHLGDIFQSLFEQSCEPCAFLNHRRERRCICEPDFRVYHYGKGAWQAYTGSRDDFVVSGGSERKRERKVAQGLRRVTKPNSPFMSGLVHSIYVIVNDLVLPFLFADLGHF
jgi:hypothetical protein